MKRNDDSNRPGSDAKSKLTRLLETEAQLEGMLKEARREAAQLVELAREEAKQRVRDFESELESEHRQLRDRIARERDEAVKSIREEAREETERLVGLDDATVHQLAQHVVGLLLNRTESGGSP